MAATSGTDLAIRFMMTPSLTAWHWLLASRLQGQPGGGYAVSLRSLGAISLLWLGFVLPTDLQSLSGVPALVETSANEQDRSHAKDTKALWRAFYERDLDGLRALLEGGVDANFRFRDGEKLSLLHYAVENSFEPDVELLLTAGADADATLANGWTAVHLASGVANRRIVKLLAVRGAKLDATDAFGATALHYAAQFGHAQMVSILLKHSEPGLAQIRDARGWTALMRAEMFERGKCGELLRRHLSHGDDADSPGEEEIAEPESPLYRLLRPRENGAIPEMPDAETLERALKKRSRSNRPIFHMTYSPNNGPASERNTHHLICSIWADGFYQVRAGYTDPVNERVLPSLRVGILSRPQLSEFLDAAEATEFFSGSLPGGFTYPCSARTSASLAHRGKILESSDAACVPMQPSMLNSRPVSQMRLSPRLHGDALFLLGRLLSKVLAPATRPFDE